MERVLDFVKRLLLPYLDPVPDGRILVDFTMGNGHDTLFFLSHAPDAALYAFDIQPEALTATRALLSEHGLSGRATLVQDSHHRFETYCGGRPIHAGIFNLGYLPGGDKRCTTQTGTTLKALRGALERLSPDGILVLVLYPGHPAGREESACVEAFCRTLDGGAYDVLKYDFINKKHPPYAIAVTRHHRTPAAKETKTP